MRMLDRTLALLCTGAVLCIIGAQAASASHTVRRGLHRRSLADAPPSAAAACQARGINASLWHAASGAEAAGALRAAVGGSPDTKVIIQTLNFGLDSATGAGVPLEAQSWPEGYVGKPFVSSFVTFLRAPYDGTYRFYLSSDDATVFTLTEPDGTPVSVTELATTPDEEGSVTTTMYEAAVPTGHYVLSLQYAKTDLTSEPKLKLEWEYPEKLTPDAADVQPGRIIPRSVWAHVEETRDLGKMLYKRDTFLDECSLPAKKMKKGSRDAGAPMVAPPEIVAPMTAPAGMMAPESAPVSSEDSLLADHAAVVKSAVTPETPAVSAMKKELAVEPAVTAAAPTHPLLIAAAPAPGPLDQAMATDATAPSVTPAGMTTAFPALPTEVAPTLGPAAGPEGAELADGVTFEGNPTTEEVGNPLAAAPEGYMYADEAGQYGEAAAPEGAEGAGGAYPEEEGVNGEASGPPLGARWAAFPGAVRAAQAPGYAAGAMLAGLAPAGSAADEAAAGPEAIGEDMALSAAPAELAAAPAAEVPLLAPTPGVALPQEPAGAAAVPASAVEPTPAVSTPVVIAEMAAAPSGESAAAAAMAPTSLPLAPTASASTPAPEGVVEAVVPVVELVEVAAGPLVSAPAANPVPLPVGPTLAAGAPLATPMVAPAPVAIAGAPMPVPAAPRVASAPDQMPGAIADAPTAVPAAPLSLLARAVAPVAEVVVPPVSIAPVVAPVVAAPAVVAAASSPFGGAPVVTPTGGSILNRSAAPAASPRAAPATSPRTGPAASPRAAVTRTGATRDAAAAETTDDAADLLSLPGGLPDLLPPRRPASSRTSSTSQKQEAGATVGGEPATSSSTHNGASSNDDTLSLNMPRLPDPMADLFGTK